MRVQQEPAYVLHRSDYRETSLLVDALTRQHGRVGLVAKGARRPRSALRAVLIPFQSLSMAWSGKGELATLTGAEADGPGIVLSGPGLVCGFYVNELVMRLLHRNDPHEMLFDHYGSVLHRLADGGNPDAALRVFEKHLLQELGYGLVLDHDVVENTPIRADAVYCYAFDRGPAQREQGEAPGVVLHGASLLALAREELTDPRDLHEAKLLMRAVLAQLLGSRPLHSRRLFQQARTRRGGTEEGDRF